jgi:hypothetical protein
MSLYCKLFGHKRSRRKARRDEETQQWRSVCEICGTRLVRESHGNWYEADA